MKPVKGKEPEKSLGIFLQEYFAHVCSMSSMHGALYLSKPGLFFWERILILLFMMSAGAMIWYCTSLFIIKHLERPMGTTIERDHVNWETFFPVFTICAPDKVNETAMKEFIREKRASNSSEMEVFLRSLVNLSVDNLHLGITTSKATSGIDPKDYQSIIRRLSSHPEHFITIQSMKQKKKFPLDHVLTEMGACSTFNSRALNALSWDYILSGRSQPDQPVYKTFYGQGDVEGSLELNLLGSWDIFFHSPLGTPSTLESQRVRLTNRSSTVTTIRLNTVDIVSHVKVKQLFHVQRKCLFYYEGTLMHSPLVYSHELCLQECRIEKMKGLCGCLLHFYRPDGSGERICGRQGISCVAKNWSK